jgi:hypothetical protein
MAAVTRVRMGWSRRFSHPGTSGTENQGFLNGPYHPTLSLTQPGAALEGDVSGPPAQAIQPGER